MTSHRSNTVVGPDGTIYISQASAARALGVHKSTIRWHLDRYGDLSMLGMLYVRCSWRGKEYPTLTALSKASGRTLPTIIYHLNRYGNTDRLGSGPVGNPGNRSKSKPVKVGPCEWPSRAAVARELGVNPSTVSRWLSEDAPQHRRDKLMALAMRRSAAAEAEAIRSAP